MAEPIHIPQVWPEFEPMMNVREAAEFLGVNYRTMENWRTWKRGPTYIKMGKRGGTGKVVYRLSDLKAYVAAGLVEGVERKK